jgi:hypothetical protein
VGDDRDCIPAQHGLRIDYREGEAWKTATEVRDATGRSVQTRWATPIETDALRIYVPAADLPRATVPGTPDGVVRVCELMLVLPDGHSVSVPELFGE